MAYIESMGGVFTQHINKENENIAKTNFKRQLGKNSPTKSTISNSVKKKQQNRTLSDAMRNHKSAGGAFSHHIFSKKSQRNNIQKPIANISLLKQKITKISIILQGEQQTEFIRVQKP